MEDYVSRREFEAALPVHKETGQPLWKLSAEEEFAARGTGGVVYEIPVLYNGQPTTKSVFIDCIETADGIGIQSIEMYVCFHWNGHWNSWRGYDHNSLILVPRVEDWDTWLVDTIRWLYKPAYEEEAHYLGNRPTPHKTKALPEVKRTPVIIKRTPPEQANPVHTVAAVAAYSGLGFTPSHFQVSVWDFIKTELKRNLVVRALAGSGKTTTIVEALKLVPSWLDVAFVAFNVRIANTLKDKRKQGKLPQWVHISTLHSLGLGNLTKAFSIKDSKAYVHEHKVLDIIQGIEQGVRETDEVQADAIHKLRYIIRDLVSLIKATLSKPVAEDILYLSDRYGIELNGDFDMLVRLVDQTFYKSIEMAKQIDYDDMIYASATEMVPCRKFDLLFVDECQDLNAAQIAFVLKSAKRIVCVGDEHQSIYGFRGADTEAMNKLISALDAVTLPLSITYRCPRSHVEYIRNRLPHIPIEAALDAIEGVIGDKTLDDLVRDAKTEDLVLCRCNAPLVAPAFALIRQGKKAVILGRDIGEGLVIFMEKIAEKSGKTVLLDILHEMAIYVSNETAKLTDAGKTNLAQLMRDKHETILALSDGCATVRDVEDKIKLVFSNNEAGVVFSSVHKAKGCEANRVWILQPDLMPHPNATQEWAVEQEWNIWYVAHSRSKNEMYFVA